MLADLDSDGRTDERVRLIGIDTPEIGECYYRQEKFIEAYFARYPRVRGFIDETIAEARETGSVRTLLGRLRRLPDLRAKSYPVRMEAERQAMNTPVQGSAADLIKRAMIRIQGDLEKTGTGAIMLLQVHDELVLEVPEKNLQPVQDMVRAGMEGALDLKVPLVVEMHTGRDWAEAHG